MGKLVVYRKCFMCRLNMNNFEFFSLIFLLLNKQWEINHDETLGNFLSEMNPYLWEDEISADHAVYAEFLDFMNNKTIGSDYGYCLVNDYLDSISYYKNIKRFLDEIDEKSWIESAEKLLSQPHKGDK